MAKGKRVKLYNKGTRNWALTDNGKDITCAPGRCVDLDEAQANKFIKNYPQDFIYSGDVPVRGTKEVKTLKADLKDANARIAELEGTDAEKAIKALKEENAELKAWVAELEKTVLLNEKKPDEEIETEDIPNDPDDNPPDGQSV